MMRVPYLLGKCGAASAAVLLWLAVSLALVPPAAGQVTGISYTLTPLVEGIFFDDDAALENAALFGGRLGLGFGELVELDGVYLYGRNLTTDLGSLTGYDGGTSALFRALPGRDVDLHRFGGNIKFNIGRGAVLPFITLGGGVVRFVPYGLNSSKSIYLSGGVGIQFSYRDRYTIVAQARNIAYRYNPSSTFMSEDDVAAVGLGPEDFETIDVNNFSASVGVQFYLGGRAGGQLTELDRALQEQFRSGLRGVSLRVEPVAAEVDFAESLGFRKDHRFVGVACGLDLGPLVGLRGFYWRGTTPDSWSDFDDIQAYGGEFKLAFNEAGGSMVPYLSLGGGHLDVRDGYVGNGFAVAEDQWFAFGGVGVLVPLGNALGIELGVRSLLMTTGGFDNLSDPNDVEASTMVYGGVSFGLGRGGRTAGPVFGREMAEARGDRDRLSSAVSSQEEDLSRIAARVDSLSRALSSQEESLEEALARAKAESEARETMKSEREATVSSEEAPSAVAPAGDEMILSGVPSVKPAKREEAETGRDRWVSLPVPEEGELYVRYGGSGGVSVETISGAPVAYLYDSATGELIALGEGDALLDRALGEASVKRAAAPDVQAVEKPGPGIVEPAAPLQSPVTIVQQPAPVVQEPALTPEEIKEIVRSALAEERREAALRQPLAPAEPAAPQKIVIEQAPVVVQQPGVRAETPVRRTEVVTVGGEPVLAREFKLRPMIGYNIDDPKQGLVGLRGEFQRVGRLYRVTSDVILGFGDDKTTYNVNLNGIYGLEMGIGDRVYPYGGLGVGLINLDDAELVLNLIVGSDIRLGYGTFFLEYMNQDFDNNRLLGGYLVEF